MDSRPAAPTAETLVFRRACAEGRLVFQHCAACGRAQFPPQGRCIACGAEAPSWRESARIGTVRTHATAAGPRNEVTDADPRAALALVELDEGFGMTMPVRGTGAAAVSPGSRVRIVFEDAAGTPASPMAEPLGETLRFDSFEPGRVYGSNTETLGDALLERWAALYPWDRPAAGRAPAGIATVLTMRAYMIVLQPRPPGNVHAGSTMRHPAPIVPGARVTTEIRCIDRQLKAGRRFVDIGSRSVDDAGHLVADGTMRLVWAA